jgi:hypothetical protein
VVRRLLLFVLMLVLGAPAVARAGPVFEGGPDLYFFPLTLRLWGAHALASDRVVKLDHRGDRELAWRVEFPSRSGQPIHVTIGVLALSSAPAHCDGLALAVPVGEPARFQRVGKQVGDGCHVETDFRDQCRVLTRDDDTQALLASFASEGSGSSGQIEVLSDPAVCEAIRTNCLTDEEARGWFPRRGGPPGYDEGFFGLRVPCSTAEETIRACYDADARREEDLKRQRFCRGLALATRTSGGGVDLQVVGVDGMEWGRDAAPPQGLVTQAGVWLVTPLTVVVDLPITTVSSVVFYGYWFGYGLGR